ncbi:MAG: dihydroorotate dehydrogenase-like protein [Candidatus Cloacimonadales bacterium]
MADLKTKYLGLELKNPLIVGSCGLTDNLESIKELAAAGAGAVVIKSLFEEQILLEIEANSSTDSRYQHTEAADYQVFYETEYKVGKYLQLIKEAKAAVDIPIIASVNCMSADKWTNFARKIEAAGADALELNIFILPADYKKDSAEIIDSYYQIIKKVTAVIEIPVAVKLGSYFDNVAATLRRISHSKVEGMVLFNRFYAPDVDIEKEKLVMGKYLTTADDKANTLRWIGIMNGLLDCDISASTGVHSGADLIKMLLVGADSVQVVSAIYEKSPQFITDALNQLSAWMQKHGYQTIADFRGKLSRESAGENTLFERVQFIKQMGDKH